MKPELITVVETASFIADAKACMSDEERAEAISMIAANPECGDLIPGGGGIRQERTGESNAGGNEHAGQRGKDAGPQIWSIRTWHG